MGSAGALAWLTLAALVQLLWGVYPAALRFLQTRIPHALTSLQLSFLINTCACPALALQSVVHGLYSIGYRRGFAAASVDAAEYGSLRVTTTDSIAVAEAAKKFEPHAHGGASPESPRQPLLGDSPQDELSGDGPAVIPDEESQLIAPAQRTPKRTGCCKKFGLLTATTAALTTLMVSQIFALLFVEAYISQMVFLLAPLLVSTLALVVLRTPLPPMFWPTLFLMLLGSGMVVGGKAQAARSGGAAAGGDSVGAGGRLGLLMWRESAVVSLDDVVGVGLSLVSAFALATFMLTVQMAGTAISEGEVLWANFPTQAVMSLGLTWGLEREKFFVLGELLPWEWATVVVVAVAINWLANLLQQVTIKLLGAPQVAAFLPLRLVGSLIASYIILAEKLDSPWEGAGAGIVMLTLTWYLWVQKRHADKAAEATLAAAAIATPITFQ